LITRKPDKSSTAGEDDSSDTSKIKKEFKGQGHAYGRNKGDLKGRDFGKLRSTEARAKIKADIETKEKEVHEKDSIVSENNRKVNEAEARNEKAKADKKVSEKVYQEKKLRIEEARRKVKGLEEDVAARKEKLKRMKADFDASEKKEGEQ
jgi:colicin import membrane protein